MSLLFSSAARQETNIRMKLISISDFLRDAGVHILQIAELFRRLELKDSEWSTYSMYLWRMFTNIEPVDDVVTESVEKTTAFAAADLEMKGADCQ